MMAMFVLGHVIGAKFAVVRARGNDRNFQLKIDEAMSCYRKAIALKPDYVDAYNNMGSLLTDQNKLEEAIVYFREALTFRHDSAEIYYNLGLALKRNDELNEAIGCYQKALRLKPEFADAYCNLGSAYFAHNNFDEALACYRKALAIKPDFSKVYYGMGVLLGEQKKNEEAIVCLQRAVELNPDRIDAWSLLLHQLQQVCDWKNLENNVQFLHQKILEMSQSDKNLFPPLALLSIPGTTAAEQKLCAESWVKNEFQLDLNPVKKSDYDFSRAPGDKISIGYFSADFKQHPVSFLMAEIFELHDRKRFNIIAYSHGPDDGSKMRQRLENSFDIFTDITNISNREAAQKIYDDHIDILVDLTGHTQG